MQVFTLCFNERQNIKAVNILLVNVMYLKLCYYYGQLKFTSTHGIYVFVWSSCINELQVS